MIYTSYFANIRNLPLTITPVGICVSPPKWFSGENYPLLAPSRELLSLYKSGQYTIPEYVERYLRETLKELCPESVYQELKKKGSPDIALCCYETPRCFCHRHTVSFWFACSGIEVYEY